MRLPPRIDRRPSHGALAPQHQGLTMKKQTKKQTLKALEAKLAKQLRKETPLTEAELERVVGGLMIHAGCDASTP
jgi:hypothetical protein